MKAVVVAHGDVLPTDRDELDDAEFVVAADGGALALDRWGVVPHLVVGDLDSLGAERATAYGWKGVTIVGFPADKDESDLELAIQRALESGADDVVLLGVFGGPRIDHALANALLLADPAYRDVELRAVYGAVRVRALHGGERLRLSGHVGSLVTLLPALGDAEGVRTEGLRYPLGGETLRFGRSRGLSNVIVASPGSVSLEHGVLLVIETRDGGV